MNTRRHHPMPFAVRALLLSALLLLTAHCSLLTAMGQSATATLSGTVVDQNGAVVPGAEVKILNPATAFARQTTSNDSGGYTFPLLPPGVYSVTAQRDGFAPIRVENVLLNVGDQKALKIELKTGDITAQVQVLSEAPLINESPAVATTIDRQFVGNLPLSGRSFQSLILLTPGVVATRSTISTDSGQFSVNGQRASANYLTVDGVSANIGVSYSSFGPDVSQNAAGALPAFSAFGSTTNLVSVDALEEFKIQTSTYSAQFGREPGGQVQLQTRAGTKDFHGTAFEYVRNEAFDANNWFNDRAGIKKPPLRQNQFGGTFNGPIGKKRTFFFFSYEGLRLTLPKTFNMLVPSMRLRQLTPAPMKALLNLWPLPTGPETTDGGAPSGAAPFVGTGPSRSTVDATSIRIDQTFGSKLTLFGRYNDAPSTNLNRILSSLTGLRGRTRTLTLGSFLSITPRLNNELRVNFSSNRGRQTLAQDDFGGAVPVDLSALTSGYNGPGPKYGNVAFFLGGAGLSAGLGDPIDSYQRQINVVDNLSLDIGSHRLKLGVDYRRLSPIFGPAPYSQQLQIFDEPALLSGQGFFIVRANQGARPVFNNISTYFQDDWSHTRRLNLSLGIRWEVNPAPYDANGLRPVTVVGVDNLPTATLAPPNAPFYKTFYKAFAPRIGAAYLLRQGAGKETVLRGGFGVYYDLGGGQGASSFTGFPFGAFTFVNNGNGDFVPYPLTSQLAAPPAFPPVSLPVTSDIFSLNPKLKLPYTLQWSLSVEQSLGVHNTVSLTYVAAAARDLITTQTLNQQPRNPVTGVLLPRPNPNFNTINYTTNGPTSDYQSLQAQFRSRLSGGLQTLVNYTWSHAIDEVSNEVETDRLERGNASFDVRHNFSAAVTYAFPRPKGGRLLSSILRDWSADAIVIAQSGQPVDIIAGTVVSSDGSRRGVRPDLVSGVPIWVEDPSSPGGRKINVAAFQRPPFIPGTSTFARQGTLGRNVVIAPGMWQANIALRRKFNITERVNLQLAAEAFNVFNHPTFGGYSSNFSPGSTSFGKATSTLDSFLGGLNALYQIGGARSMQFSVRLNF